MRAAILRSKARSLIGLRSIANFGPLNEVRNRIAEELARRESKDALVPIDRDPVPARYSDLVRRYYEKLGSNE